MSERHNCGIEVLSLILVFLLSLLLLNFVTQMLLCHVSSFYVILFYHSWDSIAIFNYLSFTSIICEYGSVVWIVCFYFSFWVSVICLFCLFNLALFKGYSWLIISGSLSTMQGQALLKIKPKLSACMPLPQPIELYSLASKCLS